MGSFRASRFGCRAIGAYLPVQSIVHYSPVRSTLALFPSPRAIHFLLTPKALTPEANRRVLPDSNGAVNKPTSVHAKIDVTLDAKDRNLVLFSTVEGDVKLEKAPNGVSITTQAEGDARRLTRLVSFRRMWRGVRR